MLEAVEKKRFKNLWHINKDQIKVCKGCEFRYICTDCRAYVEDIDDKYSKPKKARIIHILRNGINLFQLNAGQENHLR
jgi:radical SAM protein with 4Fe4S-binding SPASM domain